MTIYTVEWSIHLEAESVEDAVRQAWGILQDPESTATYFRVTGVEGEKEVNVFKDFAEILDEEDEVGTDYDVFMEHDGIKIFYAREEDETGPFEVPGVYTTDPGYRKEYEFRPEDYDTQSILDTTNDPIVTEKDIIRRALDNGSLKIPACARCGHPISFHVNYPESSKCLVNGCGCDAYLEIDDAVQLG
jgi:hypothetical protein